MGTQQLPAYEEGETHMLSFKVYFCVVKISLFPGVHLA